MESLDERAERLREASNKFLESRLGPNGLIGVTETPQVEEPPVKIPNPVEDSCYDALIYLREGMTRQEVIDIILIRNRISKEDAERIVEQTINMKGNRDDNSDSDGINND